MAFQIQTYAAPTDYVPEWLGNRKQWKEGKDFFYMKLLPLNDSEFHIVHKGAIEAEKEGGHYYDLLRKRIVEIANLEILTNDGQKFSIRNGDELIDIGRKFIDATRFGELIGEIMGAVMRHSVLSAGELKVSSSSAA